MLTRCERPNILGPPYTKWGVDGNLCSRRYKLRCAAIALVPRYTNLIKEEIFDGALGLAPRAARGCHNGEKGRGRPGMHLCPRGHRRSTHRSMGLFRVDL